jgi:predicted ArsR family transcriptional regulator
MDPAACDDVGAVAALDDPVRRALYRHVAARAEGVNRDQAARAVKISRPLAAYHLDRLVEAGLLGVDYKRPPGRTGPGAGRPAKVYSRSGREVQVSFPPRNYELAAQVLLRAANPSVASEKPPSLAEAARDFGSRLGADARAKLGRRPSKRRLLESLHAELEAVGFEPGRKGKGITLCNCPFDAIAQTHRPIVCAMNRALIEGVVEGLDLDDVTVTLDPDPGRCCVVLKTGSALN